VAKSRLVRPNLRITFSSVCFSVLIPVFFLLNMFTCRVQYVGTSRKLNCVNESASGHKLSICVCGPEWSVTTSLKPQVWNYATAAHKLYWWTLEGAGSRPESVKVFIWRFQDNQVGSNKLSLYCCVIYARARRRLKKLLI